MDTTEIIFTQVSEAIVRSNRDIAPAAIHKGASLVVDLGMDSLRLAAFIAELKVQFGNIDMTGWYVMSARHGSDTVQGLVEFLCRTLPSEAARAAR